MARKLFTLAALAAVPLGLLATLGAGSAQAAKSVTFTGSISCSLTGTLVFTPPLSNKQTKPTKATFTGTNNECKGVDGTKLTQGGETLKGSRETSSFALPANPKGSCADLSTGAVSPITVAVTWIGTSPIAPSTLKFQAGTLSASGLAEYLHGTSTGSFAGTARAALQAKSISLPSGAVVPYTAANIQKACASTGIADIQFVQPNPEPKPFGPNDNLEVGKAF